MEKKIKNLSYLMLATTITFFLTTFIGGNAQNIGLGEGISKLTITLANLTLYLVPIVFVIIFILGMSVMIPAIMAKQSRMVGRKNQEKLPLLHFIIAIICFILYFIFISSVYSAVV